MSTNIGSHLIAGFRSFHALCRSHRVYRFHHESKLGTKILFSSNFKIIYFKTIDVLSVITPYEIKKKKIINKRITNIITSITK